MKSRHILIFAGALIAALALAWALDDSVTLEPPAPRQGVQREAPQAPERTPTAQGWGDSGSPRLVPGNARDDAQPLPSDGPPTHARPEVEDHLTNSRPDLDDALLEELGYSAEAIRFIREVWNEFRDEEIALAARPPEAWASHSSRIAEIKDAMRSDLGDDDYDAMLYAVRLPNRVRIERILGSSSTVDMGLRVGDVILGYDGERVFEPDDLERLSRHQEPGQAVAVQIRRGSETREVHLEIGPLDFVFEPLWEVPPRR